MHLAKALIHGGAKLLGNHLRKRALPKKLMKRGGTEEESILATKAGSTVPGKVCQTRGDFVLTTRRIYYDGGGLLFFKSVELHLPLWRITNVTFEKGWFSYRYLAFQVGEEKCRFGLDGGAELEALLPAAIEAARTSGDFPVSF